MGANMTMRTMRLRSAVTLPAGPLPHNSAALRTACVDLPAQPSLLQTRVNSASRVAAISACGGAGKVRAARLGCFHKKTNYDPTRLTALCPPPPDITGVSPWRQVENPRLFSCLIQTNKNPLSEKEKTTNLLILIAFWSAPWHSKSAEKFNLYFFNLSLDLVQTIASVK